MIIRTLWILLSIFVLVSAGCANSPRPQATPFPSAKMQRMQSVQHWDVLAEQLSIDLARKYEQLPPDIKRMLYVDEASTSVFSKSLKNLLITHLVAKGIPIVTSFDQSTEICRHAALSCLPLRLKMDIQIVKHGGKNTPFPFKDVSLPKIASYVIYMAGDYWTSPIWAVLPLSEYIKNEYPAETNTEILINASLLEGDNVLSAESSIYYVNDNDTAIYKGHQPKAFPVHSPYNMEKSAIGIAAREGGCYYSGATELIEEGARMQTYEVHCRNGSVKVRCQEYDQCHVIF
jgi:hypothetical protein